MNREKLLVGTILLLVPLIVAGCAAGISQQEYEAVVAERDAAQARSASLEGDLTAARDEYEAVVTERDAAQARSASLEGDLTAARDEIYALIKAMPGEPPTPTPTPPSLPSMPTTQVELIRDVEYGRVDGVSLLLDIHRPKKPILGSPMPAVVVLHGGGWDGGDKVGPYQLYLAEYGFFVVSVNYRLSDVAKFPAAVEDCKCAVRWLRANAEKYNVDPNHIGVAGHSAGGHLAMMVGCADEKAGLEGTGGWEGISSRVQAVVSASGVGHLDIPPDAFYEKYFNSVSIKFIGATPKERPDLFRLASPTTHVSEDDPPLLLIHGDLDKVVSFSYSEVMSFCYNKLGLGAKVTLIKVIGGTHAFGWADHPPTSPSREEIMAIEVAFFIEHLVPR